jgi:GNAT superfamily N-acetyltransferase
VIALRRLREDEYEAWDAAHRAEYGRGLVEHVGMTREQAETKVERDVARVLPDGLATASTYIWAVEEEDRVVGTVFVGVRDGGAWLYDITIAADERGKGYGRAAMTALEDEVRALGYDTIGLNVWGGNEVARGLYRSLGWAEEAVHMRKRL